MSACVMQDDEKEEVFLLTTVGFLIKYFLIFDTKEENKENIDAKNSNHWQFAPAKKKKDG